MKTRILYIILPFLAISACDTSIEGPDNLLNPVAIKSYDDPDVLVITDATAGEGVVLLTFIDNTGLYNFKLVDNRGVELWTVKSDLSYERDSRTGYVQKVLFEEDGLITIFYNRARIRYDHNGEEVSREDDFVQFPWNTFDIRNIILGPQGEYLFMGQVFISGSRAALVAFDHGGNQLFNYLYAITSSGNHAFTGALLLDNGSYLLAGSYGSDVAAFPNSYFVTEMNSSGEAVWTRVHPTTDYESFNSEISGRDLIKTETGYYTYVIDGWGDNTAQRVVRFDEHGEEVEVQQSIDFAPVNRSYGKPPFTGSVIASHADGSLYGAMNSNEWAIVISTPGTVSWRAPYIRPHYAYFYHFRDENSTWTAAYVDRTYSNYLSAVCRMSDGKVMMAGTILSLGTDIKIIISIV